LEFALLHPDPDDEKWLRPVPPSVALAQRLQPLEREIQERRRLALVRAFIDTAAALAKEMKG